MAALCRGTGIDAQGRRADKALGHSGRGLDGQPRIEQRLVEPTAKLGARFRPDNMRLRAVALDVCEATGIHDCQVGTPPLTDGFIRGAHFVFESRQGEPHPRRHRTATAVGALGKTAATLRSMASTIGAPERLGPWADGRGLGDDVGNLEAGTIAAEPMLRWRKKRLVRPPSRCVQRAQDTIIHVTSPSLLFEEVKKLVTTNYGERYRNDERISTGFVESTVNYVVSKRMVKKQQMRWSQRGAHLLLHILTRVLNGEWEATFRQWYPGFRAHTRCAVA